jgi:hypothetical protein
VIFYKSIAPFISGLPCCLFTDALYWFDQVHPWGAENHGRFHRKIPQLIVSIVERVKKQEVSDASCYRDPLSSDQPTCGL